MYIYMYTYVDSKAIFDWQLFVSRCVMYTHVCADVSVRTYIGVYTYA